jgi:hypothetical protein
MIYTLHCLTEYLCLCSPLALFWSPWMPLPIIIGNIPVKRWLASGHAAHTLPGIGHPLACNPQHNPAPVRPSYTQSLPPLFPRLSQHSLCPSPPPQSPLLAALLFKRNSGRSCRRRLPAPILLRPLLLVRVRAYSSSPLLLPLCPVRRSKGVSTLPFNHIYWSLRGRAFAPAQHGGALARLSLVTLSNTF